MASSTPVRRTALFAKQPAPGEVKTRLVPPLTPGQAAELAECMLLDAVERLAAWSHHAALGPALRFAPPGARPWFEARLADRIELLPQRGAGLGARLAAHFEEEALRFPGATLVACGTDAPLLARETVLAAHAALAAGRDLVLSPDQGGGYALVGLRAEAAGRARELFTEVPMSTAAMCDHTLALARELGLGSAVLAPTPDVDVPADLEELSRRLAALPADAPDLPARTERWLRSRASGALPSPR